MANSEKRQRSHADLLNSERALLAFLTPNPEDTRGNTLALLASMKGVFTHVAPGRLLEMTSDECFGHYAFLTLVEQMLLVETEQRQCAVSFSDSELIIAKTFVNPDFKP